MKVIIAIFALLLSIPPLLMIGIALGPAALVMLFVLGCAVFVLGLVRAVS